MAEGRAGRAQAFTPDQYLEAVKSKRSMDNKIISKALRCSVRTMERKMNDPKYADAILKAEAYIAELAKLNYTSDLENWKVFEKLDIIKEWEDILVVREVSPKKRFAYMRAFWYVCRHLKRHPRLITIEECVELNIEMRALYRIGEPQPRGLGYLRIREGIRSFFMLVHEMSGEIISLKGITKEAGLGQGRYSKQRVSQEVRHNFEKTLKNNVKTLEEYLDGLNASVFMYSTASRITATLEFNLKTHDYELKKDRWIFEIRDKGEKGGLKWRKIILGHLLEKFKEGLSARFKIPIEQLEKELPNKTGFLFPSYVTKSSEANTSKIGPIFRRSLREAGLSYKQFPPTHIWRHTFAQDFLTATNYNYELCASLGGWKSTLILKKHYGEMDEQVLEDGLKEAMGIQVKKEIKYLEW